jgi:hypothetical protein
MTLNRQTSGHTGMSSSAAKTQVSFTTLSDLDVDALIAKSSSSKSKTPSTGRTSSHTSKGKKIKVEVPTVPKVLKVSKVPTVPISIHSTDSDSDGDYWEDEDIIEEIMNEEDIIDKALKMSKTDNDDTRKPNLNAAQKMLKVMMDKRITCYNDWIMNTDEYAEFCPDRNFDSNCAKFYKLVAAQLCNFSFGEYHTSRLLCATEESKIAKLFALQFTKKPWGDDGNVFMANLLRMHFNRQLGKHNTICFRGRSNAGKSQLAGSYVDYMVGNHYGKPINNVRSGFPFDGCINKRMILWEEPMITMDNIEDVKLLLEGNSLRADVKYASGGMDIRNTPVIITTNKALHACNVSLKEQLDNRMFAFYFGNALSNDDLQFPLDGHDWQIFFSKYLRGNFNLNHVYAFLKSKPF